MPQFRSEILTPWTQQDIGGELAHVPQIAVDFPLHKWSDVTAQPAASFPPQPNLLVLDAIVEEQDLVSIRADARYACLWCTPLVGTSPDDEPPDEPLPADAMTRLRQFLGRAGLDALTIDVAVGTEPGRTRRQVARHLKDWLQSRPPR